MKRDADSPRLAHPKTPHLTRSRSTFVSLTLSSIRQSSYSYTRASEKLPALFCPAALDAIAEVATILPTLHQATTAMVGQDRLTIGVITCSRKDDLRRRLQGSLITIELSISTEGQVSYHRYTHSRPRWPHRLLQQWRILGQCESSETVI